MNRNDDYPPDLPQQDPPSFHEPILDCCVKTNVRVRLMDGNNQFISGVIVKNGQSAPFNRVGDLIDDTDENDENDDDSSINSDSDESQSAEEDAGKTPQEKHEIAHLIKEDIRDAIYGRVFRATVLRRAKTDVWTQTTEECAIKEIPWDSIRNGRRALRSENPQDEIAAMQHLMRFYTEDIGVEKPKRCVVKKDRFGIGTSTSRRINHINNYNNRGYKPAKKDILKNCRYKRHIESRGASRRFGDARAAQSRV